MNAWWWRNLCNAMYIAIHWPFLPESYMISYMIQEENVYMKSC